MKGPSFWGDFSLSLSLSLYFHTNTHTHANEKNAFNKEEFASNLARVVFFLSFFPRARVGEKEEKKTFGEIAAN